MAEPSARIIADSVTKNGHRLTTFEHVGWRPILAEQNTHRKFSRNSASSRAIPITKNLDRFDLDFFYPAIWGAERPGMQPGPALEGRDRQDAELLWEHLQIGVSNQIHRYLDEHPLKDENGKDIEGAVRLHKSLLNRWLEVGLGQTMITTATDWDGYWWQRCHPAADANIRVMAELMHDAYLKSNPRELLLGQWHLPYFADNSGFADDWERVADHAAANNLGVIDLAKKISAGRCARVSVVNQNGQRDIENDLVLYTRLADRREDPTDPPHASPLEHIATPWPENTQHVTMPNGKVMGPLPKLGNFLGWWQMRHEELAF